MKRREFLHKGLVAGSALAVAARAASGATRKHAFDTVYLGPDKVKLSRLAMGTGTSGFRLGLGRHANRCRHHLLG